MIPCNTDIATHDVLKLATAADPEGTRTMGVLTKPDLATEKATQQAVFDLVRGKRNDLKLGYYVVRNRGADDDDSTLLDRNAVEATTFRTEPWSAIANTGRTGIKALRKRLIELLDHITKKEFPHVKSEITKRLKTSREQLQGLGSPRSDAHAQRAYLGELATRFQNVADCALDATYVNHSIFADQPELKLITRIINMNERFADMFWRNGVLVKFETSTGLDDDEQPPKSVTNQGRIDVPYDDYPELEDIIIPEPYECEPPVEDSILTKIQDVYNSSRGPELGTVSLIPPTNQLHTSLTQVLVEVWWYCLENHLQGTSEQMGASCAITCQRCDSARP